MGLLWAIIESMLQGDYQLHFFTPVVYTFFVIISIWGMAVSPRVTIVGELNISKQMMIFSLTTFFLLPAMMFVIYAILLVLSIGISIFALILWIILVALAFIATLLLWCLTIAAFILMIIGILSESARAGIIFSLVVALVVFGFLKIVDDFFVSINEFSAVYDWRLVRIAQDASEIIPSWNLLASKVHNSLSHIDHERVINFIASCMIGIGGGIVICITLRMLRYRLMALFSIRMMLPNSSAPLPDDTPWITEDLVLPVALWMSIIWLFVAFILIYLQ